MRPRGPRPRTDGSFRGRDRTFASKTVRRSPRSRRRRRRRRSDTPGTGASPNTSGRARVRLDGLSSLRVVVLLGRLRPWWLRNRNRFRLSFRNRWQIACAARLSSKFRWMEDRGQHLLIREEGMAQKPSILMILRDIRRVFRSAPPSIWDFSF